MSSVAAQGRIRRTMDERKDEPVPHRIPHPARMMIYGHPHQLKLPTIVALLLIKEGSSLMMAEAP